MVDCGEFDVAAESYVDPGQPDPGADVDTMAILSELGPEGLREILNASGILDDLAERQPDIDAGVNLVARFLASGERKPSARCLLRRALAIVIHVYGAEALQRATVAEIASDYGTGQGSLYTELKHAASALEPENGNG